MQLYEDALKLLKASLKNFNKRQFIIVKKKKNDKTKKILAAISDGKQKILWLLLRM